MVKKVLDDFFSCSFESEINKKMMYRNYEFELSKVLFYVKQLLEIDFDDFIQYIISNYNVHYLTSEDVLQYSDFTDATVNICKSLKMFGDNGYRFLEIGKILQNDGVIRNDVAYRKYGENHSKTAENIGLLQKIEYTYYLSCLGYVLEYLTDLELTDLINRLILRNRLVQRLIYRSVNNGESSYSFECGFLKEKTAIRRKSNIRKLVQKVKISTEKFKPYIEKIKF